MKAILISLAVMSAPAADFAGHYYLQNVREAGSELLLKADGTFDYMLAYGAADYWAKGTWKSDQDGVILNSSERERKAPFRLVRSEAKRIPGIRVFVLAPNGRPVPNMDLTLENDGPPADARTDSDGAAMFNVRSPRSVVFRVRVYQFESEPIPLAKDHNEFHFEINGDVITEVRFRGERLAAAGAGKVLMLRYWGEPPMKYSKQDRGGEK